MVKTPHASNAGDAGLIPGGGGVSDSTCRVLWPKKNIMKVLNLYDTSNRNRKGDLREAR